MKTFIHHDIPKLNRIDLPEGRVYETPNGLRYPSVTSVLGFQSADAIAKWREKVGEEEANRISARASNRGTKIHSLCEDYLIKGTAEPDMFDSTMFKSLVPHLDRINMKEN